jgi:glutamate-ammonia-ligase adenylyltransferase
MRYRHRDAYAFAVIAYGKLGGKELGYESDLDIIFLYDDPAADAPEIYARLAQRVNTWLSSYTAAGALYETDLRLRPNGASGLLVSSVTAFAQYQEQEAWVWEHQALTRARFAAGDPSIGQQFETIRTDVLRQQRDLPALAREITAMREKMLAGHPNPTDLFDIKHDRGGMVDVEFMVQFLVLGYSHAWPELTGNIGNLALLKVAADLGLVATENAETVRDAYRQYRRWQHALRLQGERYARIEPARARPYVEAVRQMWDHLFGEKSAPH